MYSIPMKGITCCGDCAYYNTKKHKCNRCNSIETDARSHFYDDCPLPDVVTAQEPRVMTWQDVIGAAIECKPLYIEVKDSEDKEPGDDRWAMVTQYKDSITNGMIRTMSSYVTSEILFAEDYGNAWRCWSARPTDKQRVETPWEGR